MTAQQHLKQAVLWEQAQGNKVQCFLCTHRCLIAEGKTRMYGLITFTVAVFHVGLTFYLLKRMGVIGAAWATMFTYGVATAITFAVALRVHPMPWTGVFAPLEKVGSAD